MQADIDKQVLEMMIENELKEAGYKPCISFVSIDSLIRAGIRVGTVSIVILDDNIIAVKKRISKQPVVGNTKKIDLADPTAIETILRLVKTWE